MIRLVRVLLLLAFGIAASLAKAQEQLTWQLKPGTTLRYRMQQDTQTLTQVGKRNLKTSIHQVFDETWHVNTLSDDGTAQVRFIFDRLLIKYDTPGGVMQIDTSNNVGIPEELAPLNAILRSLVGAEFQFAFTPLGEMKEVDIPNSVKLALQQRPAERAMQNNMSEEGLRALIQQSSVLLPKDPVRPGSNWNTSQNHLGMRLTVNYEYKGPHDLRGDRLARVDLKGEMSLDQKSVPPFNVTLSQQDVRGVIYFNAVQGHLQELELTQKTAIDMKMGDATGHQEIQIHTSNRLIR